MSGFQLRSGRVCSPLLRFEGGRAIVGTYEEQVDPIIGTLEEIQSRGHSYWTVYTDWLDLMMYALQGDDDSYLEVVERYDNDRPQGEREIDLYSQAFGQLQQGMAATNVDLLGEVYEQMAMTSDAFGQYFTPQHVCDAIAAMTMTFEDTSKYTRTNPPTIADPACGSGRLLVYAAKNAPEDVPRVVYYGKDKDVTCAKMTALNMCLFNMSGYAVHGDSLKVERRRVWATQSTALGGEIRELAEDEFTEADENDNEDQQQREERANAVNLREATLTEFQQ